MALFKTPDPSVLVKGLKMNLKSITLVSHHIKGKWLTVPEPWELYGPPDLHAPPKSFCNSRPEPQWATAAEPRSARTLQSLRSLLSAPDWLGKRNIQYSVTEEACPPGQRLCLLCRPLQTFAGVAALKSKII